MRWVLNFIPAYFVLALLIPVVWSLGRVYLRYRDRRNVHCPETRGEALIGVDVKHAVLAHAAGNPGLRLRSCSLWPERRACAQACLTQVR